MAFIPDEAEDRFHELTPSAERLYIYLCRTRNHQTERSFASVDTCAAKYGWKRATKFKAQKELIDKGWIQKTNDGWMLLVGDFSPVNKSKKIDSESEILDLQSKNIDEKSKKLDSYNKELTSLINQPINQQKKKNNSDELFQKEKIPSGKIKTQEPKGTRIPEDLQLTDAHRAYLSKINPHRDPVELFEAFHDHWLQSAKPTAVKVDWMAAWRSWCRIDIEKNGLAIAKPKRSLNGQRTTGATHSTDNGARGDLGSTENGATSNGNGINQSVSSADLRIQERNKKFRVNLHLE